MHPPCAAHRDSVGFAQPYTVDVLHHLEVPRCPPVSGITIDYIDYIKVCLLRALDFNNPRENIFLFKHVGFYNRIERSFRRYRNQKESKEYSGSLSQKKPTEFSLYIAPAVICIWKNLAVHSTEVLLLKTPRTDKNKNLLRERSLSISDQLRRPWRIDPFW